MVTKDHIIQWLQKLATVLAENKEYLTQLDSAIGDADHGINMDRGFTKVMEKLPTFADNDIGSVMKSTGMTLISSVGGASGPLYGTFFMRAGMKFNAHETLSSAELHQMLQAGVDGIISRGRAQPGDKTMIDTWTPALAAYSTALEGGADTLAALTVAVEAAKQGMKDTIPMQAKKGRASYLGERSIGHQDPGATSSYLMLQALLDVLANP